MKKKLCIFMIILTLLPSFIMPVRAYAGTTFREASIDDFEGTVKVIIAGGQKQYSAYEGMGLTQGDTVITSEGASATLYIDDDKEIKLGENSRLTLSELSNYIDSQSKSTGLKLWAGKIFVDIKKKLNIRSKFEITTGSTVMGVKGTQFYAACQPSSTTQNSVSTLQGEGSTERQQYTTELVVLHGTVAATSYTVIQDMYRQAFNLNTVDVHANEGVTIDSRAIVGETPKVEKVKPEQLDLMVLQKIAENPDEYDSKLRKGLDQLIIEKLKEEEEEKKRREEEEAQREANRPTPTPSYYGDVIETPTQAPTPTATVYYAPTDTPTPTPSVTPLPSTLPTPPLPSASPTPSPVPGNETVTFNYPTADLYANTSSGLILDLTPTNHEQDLQGVKVTVKNDQNKYLRAVNGDFTSSAPVYLEAYRESAKWYLGLNGTPFTDGEEFTCTITAIAYDGADGTPSTVTLHVDNTTPLLQNPETMPLELYPKITGQPDPSEASFEFTEKLSSPAKTKVENSVKNAVISKNVGDLSYHWDYDSNQHIDKFTIADISETNHILFKDTKDIAAEISDLAGNKNTVTLYMADSVPIENVSPKYVQVEEGEEENEYYTSTYEYTVPLPNGVGLNDDIINAQGFDWEDYISLGGILENKEIKEVSVSYANDHPALVVTVATNQADNNLYISGEGEGTITISNRLMFDTSTQDGYEVPLTPICATMTFTTTGIGLSIKAVDGPTCVQLEWEQTIPSSDIKVFAATGSAITGYIECTGAEANINGKTLKIAGLEMNNDYWFRLKITDGDYAGYSNVVHYVPGALDDMELYIAQEKTVPLQFAPDGYHYTVSVEDESIAHATLNEEDSTLSVSGAAFGVTDVTVTASPDNGIDDVIEYTFAVNVSPLIMLQPTPPELEIYNYFSQWVSDTYSFTLKLENGSFKENLSIYNPSGYVQLGGALKNCTISDIKNVEGKPNEIEIILQKQTDGQNDYIQVTNEAEARIMILHDLWNGSMDLITVMHVQPIC